jgi:hypothetical protein
VDLIGIHIIALIEDFTDGDIILGIIDGGTLPIGLDIGIDLGITLRCTLVEV